MHEHSTTPPLSHDPDLPLPACCLLTHLPTHSLLPVPTCPPCGVGCLFARCSRTWCVPCTCCNNPQISSASVEYGEIKTAFVYPIAIDNKARFCATHGYTLVVCHCPPLPAHLSRAAGEDASLRTGFILAPIWIHTGFRLPESRIFAGRSRCSCCSWVTAHARASERTNERTHVSGGRQHKTPSSGFLYLLLWNSCGMRE